MSRRSRPPIGHKVRLQNAHHLLDNSRAADIFCPSPLPKRPVHSVIAMSLPHRNHLCWNFNEPWEFLHIVWNGSVNGERLRGICRAQQSEARRWVPVAPAARPVACKQGGPDLALAKRMDTRDGPVMVNRLSSHGQQPAGALPRRTFLDIVLGAGFVSSALAMVYPIVRYLIPPRTAEPATAGVAVGKLAEVAPNTGRVFKFGNRPALLVRTPDGDLRAFDAVCTHLECTVQYRADISQIWCACHNGMFDLGGNVVSGPPPRPLTPLVVNLRGEAGAEEIVVSRT